MEAKAINPDCFAYQFNIGLSYAAKKDVPSEEKRSSAPARSSRNRPSRSTPAGEPVHGNKQYEKAAQMAAEASKRSGGAAGGGASAESLFSRRRAVERGRNAPKPRCSSRRP